MRLQTILALFPALTYGCGVLVHSEVTRRALHHIAQPADDISDLYQDIVDNIPLILPSIRLGSFFPDWGYNCLPATTNPSEAAHWPPFIRAAVNHLHKTYGKDSENWSDDAWSLVGVILGAAGHGSSDVTWHSLNMVGGLMKLAAAEDFDGDFAKAHNIVDPGGDFVIAASLINASNEEDYEAMDWHKGKWEIPNNDLIAIYKELGFKITGSQLRFCAARGIAALQTELVIGSEAFLEFRDQSPTTVAALETHYLGGIREMVADAVDCWVGVIHWIENKAPASEEEAWKYCNAFRAFVGFDGQTEKLPSFRTPISPLVEKRISEVTKQVKVDQKGGRLELELNLSTTDRIAAPKKVGLLTSNTYDEPVYLTANVPFSHFGSSLAYGMFQDAWNTPILSVAAPYESESYLLPHSGGAYQIPLDGLEATSNLHKFKKLTARSDSDTSGKQKEQEPVFANNLFGYAQTTWAPIAPLKDLLVVSSPGPQSFPESYDQASGGTVTVFHQGLKIWEYKSFGYFMGQAGWKQFGSTIQTGHLGASLLNVETLVMGSPEADTYYYEDDHVFPRIREGNAYAVWLRAGDPDRQSKHLPIEYHAHEELNGNITVTTFPSTPLLKATDDQTFELEFRRIFTPQGYNLTQFSKSSTFTPHTKVLLISAPNTAVFVYDFNAIDTYSRPIHTIFPPTPPAKPAKTDFGHALASGHDEKTKRDWVAISAPNEDGFRGVVYIYTITYETVHGTVESKLVKRLFDEDGEKWTKFGLVLKSDGANRLVIASPEANSYSGAAWEVEINLEKWIDELPNRRAASSQSHKAQVTLTMSVDGVEEEKWPSLPGAEKGLRRVVEGVYPNSRLGASIVLPGDLNGDGKEDLVLGLPGSGVDGGKGAVAVLFKL